MKNRRKIYKITANDVLIKNCATAISLLCDVFADGLIIY